MLGDIQSVQMILQDETFDLVSEERILLALKNSTDRVIVSLSLNSDEGLTGIYNTASNYFAVCEILHGVYSNKDNTGYNKANWYCGQGGMLLEYLRQRDLDTTGSYHCEEYEICK